MGTKHRSGLIAKDHNDTSNFVVRAVWALGLHDKRSVQAQKIIVR